MYYYVTFAVNVTFTVNVTFIVHVVHRVYLEYNLIAYMIVLYV